MTPADPNLRPPDAGEPWRTRSWLVELGTDGRYHHDLRRYIRRQPGRTAGCWPHRQRCLVMIGPDGRSDGRTGGQLAACHQTLAYAPQWQVEPVPGAPLLWAEDVPHRHRCPVDQMMWPVLRRADRAGLIRQQLQRELGDWCALCGAAGHLVIDHDHTTNLIRGLLCRDCNNHVDRTPTHATYRAAGGPAAHLHLSYR